MTVSGRNGPNWPTQVDVLPLISALPSEQRKWNWPQEVLEHISCGSTYKWMTKGKTLWIICWTNPNLRNSNPRPVCYVLARVWFLTETWRTSVAAASRRYQTISCTERDGAPAQQNEVWWGWFGRVGVFSSRFYDGGGTETLSDDLSHHLSHESTAAVAKTGEKVSSASAEWYFYTL